MTVDEKGGESGKGLCTVQTSMLFNWYGADFGPTDAERIAFIEQHISDSTEGKLIKSAREQGMEMRLEFKPYDWELNKVE